MYKVNRDELPCKFARHYTDQVPVPFGSGDCSMPGFDCTYSGDTKQPDDMVCKENKECPAYEPVPVLICNKHGEYYDWCGDCEEEGGVSL